MTDKAFPRPQFGRELVYVVQRPILLDGKELAPGTIFDKALVSERKLRQLYDQRYLRFAEVNDLPQSPSEQRAERHRRRYREDESHGSGENKSAEG